MVASTVMSAVGQRNEGIAANQEAQYKAKQAEVNAGQERASSQRAMVEELRQMRLTQSRAQAVSAASGGGALDSSVMDIIGDLETEGRYRANVKKYEGEESARDLETGAMLSRYQGKNAKKAGNMAAIGTIMSGGSKAAGMYKSAYG